MKILLSFLFILTSCTQETSPKGSLCDQALVHLTRCYYYEYKQDVLLYLVDWERICNPEKATLIMAASCKDDKVLKYFP